MLLPQICDGVFTPGRKPTTINEDRQTYGLCRETCITLWGSCPQRTICGGRLAKLRWTLPQQSHKTVLSPQRVLAKPCDAPPHRASKSDASSRACGQNTIPLTIHQLGPLVVTLVLTLVLTLRRGNGRANRRRSRKHLWDLAQLSPLCCGTRVWQHIHACKHVLGTSPNLNMHLDCVCTNGDARIWDWIYC